MGFDSYSGVVSWLEMTINFKKRREVLGALEEVEINDEKFQRCPRRIYTAQRLSQI